MSKADIERGRLLLKDLLRQQVDFARTGQGLGVAPPPVQKPCDASTPRIVLPEPAELEHLGGADFYTLVRDRRSHRARSRDSRNG